jgi:hypothetical protein
MTDQFPPAVGTVAQEAARLIEDMATMARSSFTRTEEPRTYAGPPAQEPESPAAESEPAVEACSMCGAQSDGAQGFESYDGYDNSDLDDSDRHTMDPNDPGWNDARPNDPGPSPGANDSGANDSGANDSGSHDFTGGHGARDRREIPTTCRLCPLCRGIELLRAVRPETVDLLADLALSLATTLRDVAKRSRSSEQGGSATSGSGASAAADRPHVQDILVDDETEG